MYSEVTQSGPRVSGLVFSRSRRLGVVTFIRSERGNRSNSSRLLRRNDERNYRIPIACPLVLIKTDENGRSFTAQSTPLRRVIPLRNNATARTRAQIGSVVCANCKSR